MIKHVMQACLAAAVALAIAPNASAAEKVNTTMCVACHSNVGDFIRAALIRAFPAPPATRVLQSI